MRIVDELIFHYPEQDQPSRRWTLSTLEDAPSDVDVFPRLKFLGEQAVKEPGLLGRQALASFISLLPWRLLAGWSADPLPIAGLPVLDAGDVAWSSTFSPLQAMTVALCAGPDLVRRLQGVLVKMEDPFPTALGLAHRLGTRGLLVDLIRKRAHDQPELGLLPGFMFNRRLEDPILSVAGKADPSLRISLLRGLPGHPERDWHAPFVTLSADPDPWVGVHSIAVLGRIATSKSGVLLLKMSESLERAEARVETLRACSRIGGAATMDLAFDILESSAEPVQAVALSVLVSHGFLDERLDRAASTLRASPHPQVRALSLAILARAGVTGCWDALSRLSQDQDPRNRASAAVALGFLGDGRSQGCLEGLAVDDPSRTVSTTAIRSLVRARGGLAVEVFRKALERGGIVARTAAEVLVWRAAATPAEVIEVLGAKPVAGPGLLALGVATAITGAREGIQVLAEALRSEDPNAVGWAVEAMYALGCAIPRKRLLPLLESPVAALRVRAGVALTLRGERRGLSALCDLVRSPDYCGQGLRGLLDLAAIVPNVRGRPLFREALKLLPVDATVHEREPEVDAEQEEPDGELSSLRELPNPEFMRILLNDPPPPGTPKTRRWDQNLTAVPPPQVAFAPSQPMSPLLASMEDLPALSLAPSEAPQPQAPAPVPPTAAPEPGPEPARAPVGASMVLRRPDADAQAERVAGPDLSAFAAALRNRALIGFTVGLGGLVGIAFLVIAVSQQPAGGPSSDPAVRASANRLPDLSFFPFAAVGVQLERPNKARVGMRITDAVVPGDRLAVGPNGNVHLQTALGTRLIVGGGGGIRFRGQTAPTDPVAGYAFDLVQGRIELDWKETRPLRIEFPVGILEAPRISIAVAESALTVKSGDGRWTPSGGPPQDLSAGGRVDLAAAPGSGTKPDHGKR